jgi:Protein of unknown function (DUF3592)
MAGSTVARTTQQMTMAGFVGLFGLFAGLCVIFAVGVTLTDWHEQASLARWPLVSAVVERADVIAAERDDRSGPLWNLRAHVRYAVNGVPRTATLTSRTAYSEINAEQLQAWMEQYSTGRHVDIRYDPSHETRAVFAAPELSSGAGRIRTDLIFVAVTFVACITLLALARGLRAREARAAPRADGSQRGQPLLGVVVAAMGLMVAGSGIYGAIHAEPFNADSLMAVPAGLMFVFAGVLLGLPPVSKWRNLLATLLVTCFALTFDWVAFGPGEREFEGSIGGFAFIPGEWVGRALFGAFAVVLDVIAIGMWTGRWRQTPGAGASIPIESEQSF